MANRVHIFGASGSGTTTLGTELSKRLRVPHLDSDAYYWKQTDPPFVEKNEPSVRIRQIERDISTVDSWILSGSICNWGDPLLHHFTIAVFLQLDPSIRMKRINNREIDRYSDRIQPDGDMHQKHLEFMSWAESYDTAKAPIRSLDLHEKWMTTLPCPILRQDSGRKVENLVEEVLMLVAD